MTFRAAIGGILQSILTLSVVFVYGVGPIAAIEVEHSHEDSGAPASHEHHHHYNDGEEGHHGGNNDGSDEQPNKDEDSSSHRHSHFLSFDTHVAYSPPNIQSPKVMVFANERLIPEVALCPDGPFYDLSKPPQLG